MTDRTPSTKLLPRWTRHAIGSAVLLAFVSSPPVFTTVACAASTLVHNVKVIKKVDDTIGLRNIIRFS